MYVGRSSLFHIVSTVVTPASNLLLTDLSTVKAELNLVNADANRDSVLTRYITACSQAIQTYCNRVFAVETVQDQFFPQRDAPISPVIQGVDPIQLTRWPIVELASVVECPSSANPITLTSGTNFLEDAAAGQLIRLDRRGVPKLWSPNPLTVQYSAGYVALPADLVDACIEFVKFRYFARFRDSSIRSENVAGVGEASYLYNGGPGGPDDMPGPIAAKIDRYRVPVIG